MLAIFLTADQVPMFSCRSPKRWDSPAATVTSSSRPSWPSWSSGHRDRSSIGHHEWSSIMRSPLP